MSFRHGINLSNFSYYSPEYPFVNSYLLHNYFTAGITLDANGYPVGSGKFSCILPVLDGTHSYTVEVTGPVTAVSFGTGGTMKSWTGKGQFTHTCTGVNDAVLAITTTGTAPITHVAVYRTEHADLYAKGQIWDPDFLRTIKGFSPKRFMDWGKTNSSNVSTTRSLNNSITLNALPTGCPVELMADLCNKDQTDAWICIPHLATDAMARDMITAAHKSLGPNQTLYVEFSNEVWNASFTQYKWADAQAKIHYGTKYVQYSSVDNFYGYRSGQLAKIASSIGSNVKFILATQWVGNNSKWDRILSGFHESGATNSMLGALAVAPYIWPVDVTIDQQTTWALNNDINALHTCLSGCQKRFAPKFAAHKAYADKLGTKLFLYEHNLSLYSIRQTDATKKAALVKFFTDYTHSDLGASLVIQNMKDAAAAGVTNGCFFNSVGKGGESGIWGAYPNTLGATYPMGAWLRKDVDSWLLANAPVVTNTGTLTTSSNTGPMSGTLKL